MRLIVLSFLLVACGPAAITESEVTPSTEAFQVDVTMDEWTGEVEWDLVERCALRGLSECPDLVVMLRDAECTVEGATKYIEGMGMGDVRADVLDSLASIGDCPGLTG